MLKVREIMDADMHWWSAAVLKLLQDANREKEIIREQAKPAFENLLKIWQQGYGAFRSSDYSYTESGQLALYALSAAEDMLVAYSNTEVTCEVDFDLSLLCHAAQQLSNLIPAGQPSLGVFLGLRSLKIHHGVPISCQWPLQDFKMNRHADAEMSWIIHV